MRHFYAGMLALVCVGAQAATYEFSLTNPSLSVIDLTPGDPFAPSYTVDTGDVLGLLTPSYTYAMGWVNPYEFDSWNTPRPVTAIPEPETHALLLAGLGFIGAVARRRKATTTS